MGTRMKGFGNVSALVAGLISALAAFSAFGAAPSGRGSDVAVRGDAAALAIYRGMHAAMREARSLSFESEYVRETGGKDIGRSLYRLSLAKPNYARLESKSEDGTKTGVIVLDGRQMWIYWPDGRPYIHESDSASNARGVGSSYLRKDARKGDHSIARETSVLGTGMSMTILDPSIFHGSPDLMDALLESVRSGGSVNADGEVCDIVEASYLKGLRTRVFWIARRDRLPRMLEETVRGKRDIVVRERWRDVVVDGAISKDIFKWKPPRMGGVPAAIARRRSLETGERSARFRSRTSRRLAIPAVGASRQSGLALVLAAQLPAVPQGASPSAGPSGQIRGRGARRARLQLRGRQGAGGGISSRGVDTVPERRRYDGRGAGGVSRQIPDGDGTERVAAQLHHRYPGQDRRWMVRLRERERSGGRDAQEAGIDEMIEFRQG